MGYAAGMLKNGPACLYQTIDMAGDGENNEGFGLEHAYREFPFGDVIVNEPVVNAAD